jgi:hypothetical protein
MKLRQSYFKILILLIAFTFSACSKKDAPAISGTKYTDARGTYVTVSNADWYLTTQGSGGMVNLKVSGATNADKITVTTYGDGLYSDINMSVGSNGQFTQDVTISFSATSRSTSTFQQSTTLKAYRGTDTLVVTLKSGNLSY